ncbi:MAG: preprotein translocase subunit SecG [Clostridia bacterium]|nr:preprotein translocase subunit SecG [Clostridia bacterium]
MNVFEIILGIVLLLMAIFLVVAILMQSGKDKRLSGTIAGGAETFFGKAKASTMDKMLSKVTTIVAIIFAVLVLVMYIILAR